MTKHHTSLFFALIFLGFLVRIYGLNWDQGQHLHPDERFMTMVTQAISIPKTLTQYLDTSVSTFNPNNRGFTFYVYGTFPLLITRYVVEITRNLDYGAIPLVGRFLSGIFDIGTLVLVFFISKKLFSPKTAFLSCLLYAVSVLPIQLSHFYAVDTYLAFFIALSFYLLLRIMSSRRPYIFSLLLGISFGLAVSSKISAVLFVPIIFIGYLVYLIRYKKFLILLLSGVIFIGFAYLAIRLGQPYLFNSADLFTININPKLIASWQQLIAQGRPDSPFPPAIQWLHARPLIFPLENLLLWGLGLPLGLLSLISVLFLLIKKYRSPEIILIIIWIFGLFIYQGLQFGMPMRYFLPIYPFLAVTAGFLLSRFNILFLTLTLTLTLIWPISFLSMYSRPHSRVTASVWIYQNIPSGSAITCEYWDDCLPLTLTASANPYIYKFTEMHLYDLPDNNAKWQKVNDQLSHVDYLVLTSNRLYGSIGSVPEKYSLTAKFYQDLFAGKLNFVKIAEFTSRPNFSLFPGNICLTPPFIWYGRAALSGDCPLPGLSFVDDYADESWTVYDHPKVTIFRKILPGTKTAPRIE